MENLKTEESAQNKLDKNIRENIFAKMGVTKPYTVFVLIAVVVILGMFSFSKFKMELFPNMNLPYVIVISSIDMDGIYRDVVNETTEAPYSYITNATTEGEIDAVLNGIKLARPELAETIDQADTFEKKKSLIAGMYLQTHLPAYIEQTGNYVKNLESALQRFVQVKNLTSVIRPGVAILQLEFDTSVNTGNANIEVMSAIERIDYSAQGFTKPISLKISPDLLPVYSFTSTYEGANRDALYREVENAVSSATGVASVSVQIAGGDINDGFTLVNGKLASSFSINKASDAITTEVVKNVKAELDKIAAKYPGFEYTETLNQGEYITKSVNDVVDNLLLGGFLAIVILFLFMRNWKMTLAVAIAIPLSVVGTFILMYFMGIGLNIVSMSGLALVIGMLVDNSIVVMENVFRLKQKGLPIREAAIKGASQIFNAVIASTLTTVCVFFPMFFVSGLIMQIFMDLVWVVIFALLASLFVAICFLPAIMSSFKVGETPKHSWKWAANANSWINKKLEKPTNAIKSAYNKSVNFTVKYKWASLGTAILLFVASIGLIFAMGFEIMPATDEGEFTVNVALESGAPAHAIVTDINRILKDESGELSDSIKTISISYTTGRGTGQNAIMGRSGENISINVVLKDKRPLETTAASEGAYNKILEYADTHAGNIKDVAVSSSQMSVSASSVTVTLSSSAENADVKLMAAMITVKNTLTANLGINNPNGIMKIDFDETNTTQRVRSNGKPTASMNIVLGNNAKISDVQSQVDAQMTTLLQSEEFINNGITKMDDGYSKQFNESMSQMMVALLVGLLLIYLVMVAMFQSFRLPFVILITIPLAFTGAFVLLWATGMTFSIVAVIGLIILMGVVVNNGIVMLDYVNKAREDGLSIREAVVAGAQTRARPIIITALTTIIALIPSALGLGSSGALMQPLAIASIGGLAYAMVMSLLVVPAFYCIAFNRQDRKERGIVKNKREEITNGETIQNTQIDCSELENEQDKVTGGRVSKRTRSPKNW
jgi:multidrug efflux pump subunit AcrB